MGRRNLELTWVKSLKQWRKRKTIDGKRRDFYLGTGKGRDDIASYRKALARWREIEDRLAAESEEQQLIEHIEDLKQRRRLSNGVEQWAAITEELDDLAGGVSIPKATDRSRIRSEFEMAARDGDWNRVRRHALDLACLSKMVGGDDGLALGPSRASGGFKQSHGKSRRSARPRSNAAHCLVINRPAQPNRPLLDDLGQFLVAVMLQPQSNLEAVTQRLI